MYVLSKHQILRKFRTIFFNLHDFHNNVSSTMELRCAQLAATACSCSHLCGWAVTCAILCVNLRLTWQQEIRWAVNK